MRFDVYWHNLEKGIIYCRYPTSWTWQELDEAAAESKQLMDQVEQERIYMIGDVRNGFMPSGSGTQHGMNIMRNRHEKMQFIVIVTDHLAARVLAEMVMRVSPLMRETMRLASSVEAAEAIIAAAEAKQQEHSTA